MARLPRLAVVVVGLGIGLASALAGCGGRERGVVGSGTIEMDEVDVASQTGGRVVRLAVEEGDSVRVGDTLVVLDQGEVVAGLQVRQAEADRALAQLRDVQAGPRTAEIRAAEAEQAAATAAARLAQSEFERAERLAAADVIAKAELDRARAAREESRAREAAAARAVQLLRAGSRVQQVAAARGAAQAARAQRDAAASRAGELTLTSPIAGTVLLRNFEPGEIVGAGLPVLTLGDPGRLWLRVYVATPRLAEVRLGAPVEVRAPGFGARRFTGHVVEIASRAEFTPRAALTEEERANLVFGVKVALDPTGGALKAGLPADARILAPGPAPGAR